MDSYEVVTCQSRRTRSDEPRLVDIMGDDVEAEQPRQSESEVRFLEGLGRSGPKVG